MKQFTNIQEKYLHWAFELGVLFKGLHAVIEIAGGLVFLLLSKEFISSVVFALVQNELVSDPSDVVAHFLFVSAESLSVSSQHFFALYLLLHGVVKMILAVGLLKEKLWAYPAAIGVFGLFILYQLHRYMYTHSVWLILLTIFDVFVIWLTWHEYQRKKQEWKKEGAVEYA